MEKVMMLLGSSQLILAIVLFTTFATPQEAFTSSYPTAMGKQRSSFPTEYQAVLQQPCVTFAGKSNAAIDDDDDDDDAHTRSSKGEHYTKSSDTSKLKDTNNSLSRRLFASKLVGTTTAIATSTGALFLLPPAALAGIDVSALRNLPVAGDTSGAATRLKQLQLQGTKTAQGAEYDYATSTRLDSGVTYKDINTGINGIRTVRSGSDVGVTMTIRCKSLATPGGEPSGVVGAKYYSTKDDNDSNELSAKIGFGDLPRGLEEGMMGMKLNAARRVEVPSVLVFAARNAGQLPEATTEEGKQRLASAFESGDATLVFEVYVTRISQGNKI